MSQQANDQAGLTGLLRGVDDVRSHIPSWMHRLSDAAEEAYRAKPNKDTLAMLLDADSTPGPQQAAAELHRLSSHRTLNAHVELLAQELKQAGESWAAASGGVDDLASEAETVGSHIQRALKELQGALQHALYLTYLDDARNAPVGETRDLRAYCQGWGLDDGQIDEIWLWVSQDPLRFGGEPLPLALDRQNGCVYPRAENRWKRWWLAAAPLWGGALAYTFVALAFLLLHKAGVTAWPHDWAWKMGVLVLFVALGAALHLAARAINVNYDDPIQVRAAGGVGDWLSLRWLGILQMYVPIVFVVGSLWGAGNVPESFQSLGTAILAGYSADSLFRAAVSNVQERAAKAGSAQGTASAA